MNALDDKRQRNWLIRFQNEALIQNATPRDGLAVPAERIRAVVMGGSEFSGDEALQLLDCRNSLRLFQRFLQQQQRARKRLGWGGSHALLRAAAGDDEAMPALDTEDGLCTLRFLQDAEGWRMVLSGGDLKARIDAGAEEGIKPRLQVFDQDGHVLLEGELDDYAELEGRWPFSVPPRKYFETAGHAIHVVPVID